MLICFRFTHRLAKGDSCHSDLANSEDDWMNDCLKEGRDKSSEINALATLVGFLYKWMIKNCFQQYNSSIISKLLFCEVQQEPLIFFFWCMWTSRRVVNVLSMCIFIWTFITHPLVHIHQKKKSQLKSQQKLQM